MICLIITVNIIIILIDCEHTKCEIHDSGIVHNITLVNLPKEVYIQNGRKVVL